MWQATKRIAQAPIQPKEWVSAAARWWLGKGEEIRPVPEPPPPPSPSPVEDWVPEPVARPTVPEPVRFTPVCGRCGRANPAWRRYANGNVECVQCADLHTEGHRR